MQEDEKLRQWEETQLKWDDTEFLEKRANSLMKLRWERLNERVAKAAAEEVVKKNEYISFLDVGAGRGDFYRRVENIVKKYTGLEPSEKMLPYEIREENFELLRGSGESMNYENLYDFCLIKEVLDHCFAPKKVIENSFKALKPGGLLVITLTNRNSYYKLLFKEEARRLEEEHRDHLYNFSPEEVMDMVRAAGFEPERSLSANYLRLPEAAEEALGRLGKRPVFSLLEFTDALGAFFLKNKGGSFIITARKKGGNEEGN